MLIEYDMGMDLDIETGLNILFIKDYSIQSQAMEPIIHRLSEEFEDICFTIISVDDINGLGEEYNIRSSPTIIFLQDNSVLTSIQGVITEKLLAEKIERILK